MSRNVFRESACAEAIVAIKVVLAAPDSTVMKVIHAIRVFIKVLHALASPVSYLDNDFRFGI